MEANCCDNMCIHLLVVPSFCKHGIYDNQSLMFTNYKELNSKENKGKNAVKVKGPPRNSSGMGHLLTTKILAENAKLFSSLSLSSGQVSKLGRMHSYSMEVYSVLPNHKSVSPIIFCTHIVAGEYVRIKQDIRLQANETRESTVAPIVVKIVGSYSKKVEGLFIDIMSEEKRLFEDLKSAKKMDKAKLSLMEITSEINKLAKQVGNLEREIYGGKKVDEIVLFNFIELLMSHLIKLDGIVADCYMKLQRRLHVDFT
ncbi:hypothetical protein L1987_18579 [Smallanthus sonchifolius]|uniref:Uncharacterized protein n=1 Tax=Smallanthus sonchifolius TaxID=185202 RepID=A0ACB9J0Z4_9ASTR|nr:hypothetical protein L1987_18579 [Smallanthus sonchifolius]